MPLLPLGQALLGAACMTAWGDFNDAVPLPDDSAGEIPSGGQIAVDRLPSDGESTLPACGYLAPDIEQIAAFLDVVFGYCDGLIPVRGFVDQGQGLDTKPHNIWVPADRHAANLRRFADGWFAYMGTQARASQDITLIAPKPPTTTTPDGMGPGGSQGPPPGGGR